jgi:hypothetical protein
MRYRAGHVLIVSAFSLFFATACFAQGSLHVDESAIRIEFLSDRTSVELPVRNDDRRPIAAHASVEFVDPIGVVKFGAGQDTTLPPGRTVLKISTTAPNQKNNPTDRKELLWYRLRYSVTNSAPTATDGEHIRGILSVSQAAPKLFELHVVGPPLVKVDSPATLRVRAVHPVTLQPVAGVVVQGAVDLDTDSDKPLLTPEAKTDRQGFASLHFSLPRGSDADHEYSIDITVTGRLGDVSEKAEGHVAINHFSSVLLSTDKPMYQPGQTLHTRLVAFDENHRAVAKQAMTIQIRDPENSVVFRSTPETSRFGVAALDWDIPENIRLGEYALEATIGDEGPTKAIGRAVVKISRYDLPTFSVAVKPDRTYYPPGQNAEIEVRADYLFGEPVTRGHVRVVQESERSWNFREQRWDVSEASASEGETDNTGRYVARVDLSADQANLTGDDYRRFRDLSFAAYFTDSSTGRTEQRRLDVRVTKEPIHVYFIAPNEWPPSGLPLEFFVSTDYADGTPAQCDVEIGWADGASSNDLGIPPVRQFLRRIRTSRFGVAKITGLTMPAEAASGSGDLTFRARDRKGLIGTHAESNWASDRPGIRVETNKTLYALNEPIDVELSSSVRDAMLVVEAQHEYQTVASQIVRVRQGRGSLTFPPNPAFQNRVTIVAYNLGTRTDDGNDSITGNRSIYFPKNNALNVEIHSSKTSYRPGEEASATIQVTDPDGNESASDLGLVVVDKAVEERAQTDSDFGPGGGFFQFRSYWRGDEELNGIRITDLDKLNLSKLLPDGLEVAADALLQMEPAYPEPFDSDLHEGSLKTLFASEINPALEPIRAALELRYVQKQTFPKTEGELAEELAASDIRRGSVLDPWGNTYRPLFGIDREMSILKFVSAGPDKRFDTEDDFVALELKWPYFKPYSEAIQKAVDEFHKRTGGYIRDLATLEGELAHRGIDLSALRDPWGHAYRYEFGIHQTQFTITVLSPGPDRPPNSRNKNSSQEFSLSTIAIDYFAETLAAIDAALNQSFSDHQSFPQDMSELTKILQDAGISWSDLRDPWGHLYYAVFREGAVYSDKIDYETYDNHLARATKHLETTPVTRTMRYFYIRSAGEDGIEGTSDDFFAASFSRGIVEKTAQNPNGVATVNTPVFSGSTGAISGLVSDQSGGIISGAHVTAANLSTGQAFEATTDDSGAYVLRNLPAGEYVVRFTAKGFRSTAITNVPIRSSSTTKLDAVLNVGETNQTVTVTESLPQVETTMATLGRVTKGTQATSSPRQMMTPRLREYFPETLYWQPELVTDKNGRALLKFPLAGNITTWKLSAIASTENGEIGTVDKEIRAFQPFFVEHDPPKFLTAGDEIDLPVVVRNYVDRSLQLTTEIKPEAWYSSLGPTWVKTSVPARDNAREIFKFRATSAVKAGKQRITASGVDVADAIERAVTVRPNGEERIESASQVFSENVAINVHVPESAIPGSLEGTLKIYPNLNAHVIESIEGILERPYGCAEQTISSAYPSLLLLQYARNMSGAPPALVARAKHFVQLGYDRLLSYQATGGGITYWGRGAPDPALTAYGLRFLNDAREFVQVDDAYIQADLTWLLQHSEKDGRWIATNWDGTENTNRTMMLTAYVARIIATTRIASPDPTENAHLLSEASSAVQLALAFLEPQVNAYDEPYLIASYALASLATAQRPRAEAAVNRLRALERREGDTSYWVLETNTPFYGWGLTGRIETTALAVQALHDVDESSGPDAPLVSRGLLFLLRSQDRFGIWYSTQATVNVLSTLRSLTASARVTASASAKSSATTSLFVDGRQALTMSLPGADELTAPVIVDVSKFLGVGAHRLEIRRDAKSSPASLQLITDYYVPWTHTGAVEALHHEDKSSDALLLRVQYDKQSAKTGDEIRCDVEAERIGFRGYGMLLTEVGLPPGADVDRNSLETAATASGWEINHYDVLPDRVVVYLWPRAGGTKFHFTFRTRFGMNALTPPSTLYDYYNPEAHATVEPVQFQVTEP